MIEVLVTIVILSLGLLGLAGLQSRLQATETETYQRSQALILLTDMMNRLSSNRTNAASYATETPLGIGNCPDIGTARHQSDLREWCLALQGNAEQRAGAASGAMTNALGCITPFGSNSYRVTVSWQGIGALPSDPNAAGCSDASYGQTRRRALVSVVTIGTL